MFSTSRFQVYTLFMSQIPFHRRILPWIFALIFVFMAPAVVFYTAGYRWNSNKGIIERNGTLILETVPTGASIYLNGEKNKEVTPATLQQTPPGTYEIVFKLQGYHDWKKTLQIQPELVTFANQVILWPDVKPVLQTENQIIRLFSDPNNNVLVAGLGQANKITEFGIVDLKTGKITDNAKSPVPLQIASADWSSDGRTALLYVQTSSTHSEWLLQTSPLSVSELPDGIYHWQNSLLQGYTDTDSINITASDQAQKQTKQNNIRDTIDNFKLSTVSGTLNLVLSSGNNPQEGTILPTGNWQIRSLFRGYITLQDSNSWLWINTNSQPYKTTTASGEWLYPLDLKNQRSYLFKNGNEIWTWTLGKDPELIYRLSEPIIAVSWHPAGQDLLAATSKQIMMVNLDARGGHAVTNLGNFDSITDATIVNGTAYIAGTRDGKTGLWRINLSATGSTILNNL